MRTHVDLFSGIGGFSLACEWAGVETIAFAEIDDYASRVLRKHWPNVRNYGDVRNVPALESVWLVTGGVPCQPASVAGKRRGTEDDRWLWPQALAANERIRPAWVLFENPTGILSLNDGVEFERICVALEGQGYEVQPLVIPACGVGAPHRRNRVWILAHAASGDARGRAEQFKGKEPANGKSPLVLPDASSRGGATTAGDNYEDVANTNGTRPQGRVSAELRERSGQQSLGAGSASVADTSKATTGKVRTAITKRTRVISSGSWWATEPNVGRVANGIPKRVDRLRCLGNSIVPQVAHQLIKRMIEAEECSK